MTSGLINTQNISDQPRAIMGEGASPNQISSAAHRAFQIFLLVLLAGFAFVPLGCLVVISCSTERIF